MSNQFNQRSRSAVTLARGIDLEYTSVTAFPLQLTTLTVLRGDAIEKLLCDLAVRTATFHTAFAAIFLGRLASEVPEDTTLVSQLLDVIGSFMSFLGISDDFVEIKDIDCAPFKAEIHETKTDSTGIMKMEKIESLLLNPDSQIIFVPGGKHIMLQGLSGFKEPELDCSFILTDQDPIKFKFEVIKRG